MKRLRDECSGYVPTQYFPGFLSGEVRDGFRCEDLACQSFDDACFDLVITQDVLEHLLEPVESMREICRTLQPGGNHLFTVPWYFWKDTKVRARKGERGTEHVELPEYHSNPVDSNGSLVVTEWGKDLCETIFASCGMSTTVHTTKDRHRGIDAQFIEVFVSTKPVARRADGLLERWGQL